MLSLIALLIPLLALAADTSKATPAPQATPNQHEVPANRVASIYVAESFINEQIRSHVKSPMIRDIKLVIDPDKERIYLRGLTQVPVEELRAIDLDPTLGAFNFQVAAKLRATKHGHLEIEFPLNETYFYPAVSKHPEQDRVIIPVQMLSIALASARGFLAALSGDFGGFDRRTQKLNALASALDRSIRTEKNADALEEMKTERQSMRLQLQAIPLERKQLENMSKELSKVLAFTGEKELSLNDEIRAKRNSLVLRIRLSQITPYLNGVDLGGIRLRHDKKDGAGENYLVIDANSDLKGAVAPPPLVLLSSPRPPMKVAPDLIIRLNQALLESQSLVDAEKKKMGDKLRDFTMNLEEDGLHVSGRYHTLLFFSVPFSTVVDFTQKKPDIFNVRVRDITVAGLDFEFLSGFILESIKKRLDESLKGMCTFEYIGERKDHSRALRVTVDPKQLVPAFPELHLIDVDIRKREFLLKIGKVS